MCPLASTSFFSDTYTLRSVPIVSSDGVFSSSADGGVFGVARFPLVGGTLLWFAIHVSSALPDENLPS